MDSFFVETQFKLPDNFLQEYLTFIEFMDNIPMNNQI